METCDLLTMWSANNYQSFTCMGKIITPNTVPLSTGNEVKEDVVFYFPKPATKKNPRYRITAISNISLALIIETNIHELQKKGVEITNSTKLNTVIQIQIDDKNESNFRLLESVIGINSYGESATAVIFDDSVPPSAFLDGEFGDYGNINNFDLNNL